MKQDSMKAFVYQGPHDMKLKDVPMPQIIKSTDVIVRVTTSTICGSDIHLMHGMLPFAIPGTVAGHECCGEIVEVGSAVKKFNVGDRVAVAAIIACGECFFCKRCEYDHCEGAGLEFLPGFTTDGCQAEYMRLPYADHNLYNIPASLSDEDVLFAVDVLSTGYTAGEKAGIKHGDTVVVIGAGPVGLSAMATARLWSPARIIAVDLEQSRLETAVKAGIADISINSGKEDALAKIREMTEGRGADVALEAVGFKQTLALALDCVRPNGHVSAVGAFTEPMEFDLPTLWMKNLTINMSLVCLKNISLIIKLIEAEKLNARFLITHRAPLNDIVKGYDVFGNKKENCIKWVVTPYEK